MKVCEARQARSMWGNATLGFLVSMATLGCTPLQPPGAAPQRTATPGGVTAASPVPSGSGISDQCAATPPGASDRACHFAGLWRSRSNARSSNRHSHSRRASSTGASSRAGL